MPINTTTKRYHYGTAGFRLPASQMQPVAQGMAHVLARFANASFPSAVGLLFTASHNPPTDNGVKMIGGNGLMAGEEWERVAEEIVNGDVVVSGGDCRGVVLVGRDTRTSGIELVRVLLEGLQQYPNITIIDIGMVTTPQGHFLIHHYNCSREWTLSSGLEEYYKLLTSSLCNITIPSIHVDCANGVGTVALLALKDKYPEIFRNVQLFNYKIGEPAVLNQKCGADHVKSTLSPPSSYQSSMSFGASLDGDADRLIMWYNNGSAFKVLDGDKLSVLFADHFKSNCKLKTAVVQTPYANGASTEYLQNNNIKCVYACTGVKNLHAVAENLIAEGYQAVVYFEGNGHGTVLFGEGVDLQVVQMVNRWCGDGVSDLLLTALILHQTGKTVSEWDGMYEDRPCRLFKVSVRDKQLFKSSQLDERILVEPRGLQSQIDTLLTGTAARAFVRPSGTEDCVRVYVEAECNDTVERLATAIKNLLTAYQ